MIPYDEDASEKHSLKSVGRTKDLSIKGLMQKDTRLNQVDVEQVNLLNTELNRTDAKEVDLLSTEFKRRFDERNRDWKLKNFLKIKLSIKRVQFLTIFILTVPLR